MGAEIIRRKLRKSRTNVGRSAALDIFTNPHRLSMVQNTPRVSVLAVVPTCLMMYASNHETP